MPPYRGCEVATGREECPATIGGASIAYAAIPITKRTGMTIGGMRYFMGFHAKENWIGCVAGDRSQHAEEHRGPKGKTGEHDHRLNIFLALCISLLSTRRCRPLVFWQKLDQLPADGQIV